MEKKKKSASTNGKPGGAKRNRGAGRGRGGFRGRGARIKRNVGATLKKQQQQTWQRNASTANNARGGFARNRFKRNGNLTRSRSNLSLNYKPNNVRGGAFNVRRGRGNRFGLTRSRSRTNLTFNQGGFFTNNKSPLKRTNSLPNLRDPNSVHNRLGYQSPAQIAYRNRVKRAKQLLLQRQNQRLNLQNQFRVSGILGHAYDKYSTCENYSLHTDDACINCYRWHNPARKPCYFRCSQELWEGNRY